MQVRFIPGILRGNLVSQPSYGDFPLVVSVTPTLSTERAVTSPSPRRFHYGRVICVSLWCCKRWILLWNVSLKDVCGKNIPSLFKWPWISKTLQLPTVRRKQLTELPTVQSWRSMLGTMKWAVWCPKGKRLQHIMDAIIYRHFRLRIWYYWGVST